MSPNAQTKSRRQTNRPKGQLGNNNNMPSTGGWKIKPKLVSGEEEINEVEQCLICASRIRYAALSACQHTTCHVCTLRQRALFKKNTCLVCRTENPRMIITEQITKSYDDFQPSSFAALDEEYDLGFTSLEARDASLKLLENSCSICGEVFTTFSRLEGHVKAEHEQSFCSLCATHKKAFPCELKIYSQKQLQTHLTKGDEKGFNGHPACKFCKGKRFYSEDELLVHMRESHEKCHVCDQINPAVPRYFKNYYSLEDHFKRDHFVCNVQSCLDEKFVVFSDELDLQAHMLVKHPSLVKGNVIGANYLSGNGNKYHSQLSTFHPVPNSMNKHRDTNTAADTISLDSKKMRLDERARHYLNYSPESFEQFQEINNTYKNGKLSATQVLKSYKELFSKSSENDIYLLVHDLSEIFPDHSEKSKQLSALVLQHEQHLKHEQNFPALPGSSSDLTFSSSWGSNSKPTSKNNKSLNEHFPSLSSAHSSNPIKPVKTTVNYKTVFTGKQKSATVRISNTKSNYVPSYLNNNTSLPAKSKTLDESAFPPLPSAKSTKKVIPRVNPISAGNGVWLSGSSSSSHSSSPASSSSAMNLGSLNDTLPTSKNKKKKKQILFQTGGGR